MLHTLYIYYIPYTTYYMPHPLKTDRGCKLHHLERDGHPISTLLRNGGGTHLHPLKRYGDGTNLHPGHTYFPKRDGMPPPPP